MGKEQEISRERTQRGKIMMGKSWDGSIADLRFEISKMNREREMAGCWLIGHAGWWSKIAKNFTVSLPGCGCMTEKKC